MDRMTLRGVVNAALSSSTFGLAPLFSILLLTEGFSPFDVLSYRWGVASLSLAVFAFLTGHSFRVRRNEVMPLIFLSLFRASTSLCLVFAYKNIASGVASTIHFMYPLFVALMMMVFYKEEKSPVVISALLASLTGAILLSGDSEGGIGGDTVTGLVCASVSVITYGLYIIGVRKTRASNIDSVAMTCYVMGIGAAIFIAGASVFGDGVRLVPFSDSRLWLYIAGLALPATAISNMTLVYAVKQAGPTLTSVLGAMEPLTAVVIGITVFGEHFTLRTAAGIFLILAAVLAVVLRTAKRN